ncbi:MAG TPA: hypothetical protein DCR93_01725 [Cytophagales bacterium]|nr:hypothetical protein [Cytophagales bacterium]HAP58271.1 hypothetical protein [Cytophagales bacterium]
MSDLLFFMQEKQGIPPEVVDRLLVEILDAADSLGEWPTKGQLEPFLSEPGKQHRRIIVRHVKIVYLIMEDHIRVTDFFDSRQRPDKLKL